MSPKVATEKQKKYPVGIPLIILLATGLGWWVVTATQSLSAQYDEVERQLAANQQPFLQTINFKSRSTPIVLPLDDPFRMTGRWVYAATEHPLPKEYAPVALSRLNVAHTVGRTAFRLQPDAVNSLTNLFKAASDDNMPLIAVSAYRSITEQQTLYDYMVAIVGRETAAQSIALPGASEHHTGLAVDVNSYTKECETDAQQCGISPSTSAWLATHAPSYGFIIRYPDGKLEQTGIGYEPWHLRFIGKDAQALTDSGLSLDELYIQVTAK